MKVIKNYDYQPRQDLIGKRFGDQVVIGFAYYRRLENRKYGHPYWVVECDCGNVRDVAQPALMRGKIVSCGCRQRNKTDEEVGFKRVYNAYRCSATRDSRVIPFELTLEQVKELVTSPCHYCGFEGSPSIYKTSAREITLITNGIDRKDNDKGYDIDNVVSCCEICNFGKRSRSYSEFIEYLDRVSRFRR